MKPFIVISTYNERENIQELIEKIFSYAPTCEVVVVDDHSPDGTWKMVEEISAKNPRVHLIHRIQERGRGSAGIAGFRYALERGAEVIFEMDADFSHDPRYLPYFLSAIKDYDVVSGSRYIQNGQDVDRGWARRLITFGANVYIRQILRLKLRDCSSGYRCFRAEVLRNMQLETMKSVGPSIVQETLLRACQMGYRILEIPIVFNDRKKGQTKLTYRHLVNGFMMVLRLRWARPIRRIEKAASQFPVPKLAESKN